MIRKNANLCVRQIKIAVLISYVGIGVWVGTNVGVSDKVGAGEIVGFDVGSNVGDKVG